MVLKVPDRAQDNHNGGHQVANQPPLKAGNGCLDVASELRSECGKVGLRRQLLVGLADSLDDRLGVLGLDPGGFEVLDGSMRVDGDGHAPILPVRGSG